MWHGKLVYSNDIFLCKWISLITLVILSIPLIEFILIKKLVYLSKNLYDSPILFIILFVNVVNNTISFLLLINDSIAYIVLMYKYVHRVYVMCCTILI